MVRQALRKLVKEIRLRWPEELPDADYIVLVSGIPEGTKGRLEAWNRKLKSKALRLNIKKANMMISENAEKVTEEGQVSWCCLQKGCRLQFYSLPVLQVFTLTLVESYYVLMFLFISKSFDLNVETIFNHFTNVSTILIRLTVSTFTLFFSFR